MARTYTPMDGAALLTAIGRQVTGQTDFATVNAANYVSAGETIKQYGIENVYNALTMLLGRTLIGIRSREEKLINMRAISTDSYTSRLRKISYYSEDPLNSGYFNTDLYTNLAEGYTAGENKDADGNPKSTKSQWEQHPGKMLEMHFGGSTTWQMAITQYEKQVNASLRDPEEMARIFGGMLTRYANDVIRTKESFSRMTLLNKIAACFHYAQQNIVADNAINLTAAFNEFFGTTYTSNELRTIHLQEFLQFMTAYIKELSDRFTEEGVQYHLPMTVTENGKQLSILRITPKNMQRLYLYSPLFRMAESMVFSTVFNPQYLDMDNYEGLTFWQSNNNNNRASVDFIGSFYDPASGTQNATSRVQIPYVVGVLMDYEAAMVDFQMEDAYTTPIEARKGFRNTWLTIAKNAINDPTEKAVVLYMAD